MAVCSSQVSCFPCSSSSFSQGLPLGHSMASQMEDVGNQFFFRYWAFFSSSVWILVIGLISSLLNLLWDVTIYHIVSGFEMIYHNKKPLPWLNYHTVSDGEDSNFKRQLTLTPYYFVHFAFRSLAIATFFIYMKVSFDNLNLMVLIFSFIS